MAAFIVDGPELKAAGRKRQRRWHEVDLAQSKSRRIHVAQTGLGPGVIHRHEEDYIVRQGESVIKKDPNLAPGWIGDYPIVTPGVLQEVAPPFDLTPVGVGWQAVKDVPIASTGLKDPAGGREVGHELTGERRWRLDVVVGDVISIGLVAHPHLQVTPGDSVQTKKRPGLSFDKPGHKPGNDLLSRDLTSYYHWLRGA